jgi:hypothetical protein
MLQPAGKVDSQLIHQIKPMQRSMKIKPVPMQAIANRPACKNGGYDKKQLYAPVGWNGFPPVQPATFPLLAVQQAV